MNKYFFILFIISFSCTTKEKYSPGNYFDPHQKDSLSTSIISYIYTAPPYTAMQDRFKPEHREYYSQLTSKFSLEKFFVGEDGINYFLVLRPGNRSDEMRAVGGYFKKDEHFNLKEFREVFVTPLLSAADAKERGSFLFDKMVKKETDEYLKMKSYVQWPNEASEYDTTTYEWKLKGKL